jgi:peptidoglycan/xylan/chitin deacetylase (PgdA/CDA1 family)
MLVLLAHVLLRAGPASANWPGIQTIYRFDTNERVVVLTFDTDTVSGNEAAILDILADKHVPVSFAVTGSWASQHPDVLQRMVQHGHHLINHSWSHSSFSYLDSSTRAAELIQTEAFVREKVGVDLRPYFRPPYGDSNSSVVADAASTGYHVNVWWTVDSFGWQGLSADQIRERVLALTAPGAIILMHSGKQTQDLAALPDLIDQLRRQGYRFATVDQMLTHPPSSAPRYFPETNHWLANGFLTYWEQFGGLDVFGYPLTDEIREHGTTVQYFERARFEYHPSAIPERYDVVLGLVGDALSKQASQRLPFRPTMPNNNPECTFYPPTNHHLCYGFRDYWQLHGGLLTFGYPLSEEFIENGVTVQYFERARLEYDPTNAADQIRVGRVGAELLARQSVNNIPVSNDALTSITPR